MISFREPEPGKSITWTAPMLKRFKKVVRNAIADKR